MHLSPRLLPTKSATLLRCVKDLQEHLKQVDRIYDVCSSAWAQGEAEKFTGEAFHDCNPSHVYSITNTANGQHHVWLSGSTMQLRHP